MTEYIEDRLASIPLDGGPSVEEEVEAEQSMNIYCEAVEALPEKCRRVFIMRKVNGMRHKEIADHLGITVGAVEKHLHNGARSCRAYIICANSEGAAGDEENPSHSHSKRGLN
jgi:RNA polymerase sigma-70 factor (ECF subfamily)